MQLKLTNTQRALARRLRTQRERMNDLTPAARRLGEFVTREGKRRAPRGDSQRGTSLQSSLNHVEPAHNATVLRSNKVYAGVQQHGGTIAAGAGRLGAKMLAIPVSDAARRYIGTLGAGTSLRDGPFKLFIVVVNGRLFLAKKAGAKAQTTTRRDRQGREKARRRIESVVQGGEVKKIEIMFLLRKSVRLNPNPAPGGYAPRMSEKPVRDFAGRCVARHLKGDVS